MSEVSSEKSVKLPTFDGDYKKFQLWWTRFEVYAEYYNFHQALTDEDDEIRPSSEAEKIDTSTEEGKAKAAAKKRNQVAMMNLTLAFTNESVMVMIYRARTKEWPRGLAKLVVEALMKKYRPIDTISRVELRQKLNKVTMKKGADPATLFAQLNVIENQYTAQDRTIDEGDLIAVVLDAAPEEYQAVLTAEQRARGDNLKLTDLEIVMNQHWRQMKRNHKGERSDDEGEIVLAAFGGVCYNCNKKGHAANRCPEKEAKSEGAKKAKFNGKCSNCGKVGHKAADCWEKEENKHKRPKGYKTANERSSGSETGASAVDGHGPKIEFLLCGMSFPNDVEFLNDPNVWIADTAATVHMTPHREGLTNVRKATVSDAITMGNGTAENALEIGDIIGTICDKHGNELGTGKLTDVTVLPTGKYNLFSVTQMLKKGWKLSGNDQALTLAKGDCEISFDIQIPTPKGKLFAMYVKRHENREVGNALRDGKTVRMNFNEAHDKLGHMSNTLTKATAKQLGWQLIGAIKPCESCAIAKAKQKNVPKKSEHQIATKNGERIFLDISSVKTMEKLDKTASRPFWRIMVDERTQLKFSDFFDTKDGMVEPTCEQLYRWMQNGKVVKYIRLDDAGENLALQARAHSEAWKLNIEFEFTGRDTPQRNHLAELGFAVLANRGRAIMVRAHVPKDIRYLLWREAFKTATLLDGLQMVTIDGKEATRYEHWCGKNPDFAQHLRIWGEAGTVKLRTSMTPKLSDRGATCMMVGYAWNHPGDTYRMWDPRTKRIHITRDVIWLRRMFYTMDNKKTTEITDEPILERRLLEPPNTEVGEGDKDKDNENEENENDDVNNVEDENEESNETENDENEDLANQEGDIENSGDNNEEDNENNWTRVVSNRSGRTIRPPARLIEEMNAIAIENYYSVLENCDDVDDSGIEYGLVGAGLGGGFDVTTELHVMKYKEAMAGPDKHEWTKAVEEEHTRMKNHDVWMPTPIDQIPRGSKILTTTWAMKKKANGKYRARLNARGFEQVDGIHYDEDTKAAPVTNEITIRIVLILMAMANWCAHVLDVQGAFLNGRFEGGEQLYMEIPEGLEKYYPGNTVLKLKRTIYGLKQAAYAFWRELLKAFKAMHYVRSQADPCLYYRWSDDELILWISWVDDCLVVGSKHQVLKAKEEMKSLFDCDDIGELKEYVGCKIDYDSHSGTVKFTQPVLLQSFRDEFGIPDSVRHETAATPGETLRGGETKNFVSADRMAKFRSGVGKLLHLTKWSRPDIQNIVRELSRFMMKALGAHEAAMRRVMEYCVSTPNRGLCLKPVGYWNGRDKDYLFRIHGMSDSDYAKDPET